MLGISTGGGLVRGCGHIRSVTVILSVVIAHDELSGGSVSRCHGRRFLMVVRLRKAPSNVNSGSCGFHEAHSGAMRRRLRRHKFGR